MLERLKYWYGKYREKNEVWEICPFPPYAIHNAKMVLFGFAGGILPLGFVYLLDNGGATEDWVTLGLTTVLLFLMFYALTDWEKRLRDLTDSLGLPLSWIDRCMFDVFDQIEEAYI